MDYCFDLPQLLPNVFPSLNQSPDKISPIGASWFFQKSSSHLIRQFSWTLHSFRRTFLLQGLVDEKYLSLAKRFALRQRGQKSRSPVLRNLRLAGRSGSWCQEGMITQRWSASCYGIRLVWLHPIQTNQPETKATSSMCASLLRLCSCFSVSNFTCLSDSEGLASYESIEHNVCTNQDFFGTPSFVNWSRCIFAYPYKDPNKEYIQSCRQDAQIHKVQSIWLICMNFPIHRWQGQPNSMDSTKRSPQAAAASVEQAGRGLKSWRGWENSKRPLVQSPLRLKDLKSLKTKQTVDAIPLKIHCN